jgi:regulator of replication initiation timing
MFGFFKKQPEIVLQPVDNKKEIEKSLEEVRREMNDVRNLLTTAMEKHAKDQASLQILRDRASELEDAINTANMLSSSLSGADKARYDNLVSIATSELGHNAAQQEELILTVTEAETFITKTRELVLTFETRLVEFQSNVDALRVRQSTAAIETKINTAADTLKEFRRDVFVTEALAELTR